MHKCSQHRLRFQARTKCTRSSVHAHKVARGTVSEALVSSVALYPFLHHPVGGRYAHFFITQCQLILMVVNAELSHSGLVGACMLKGLRRTCAQQLRLVWCMLDFRPLWSIHLSSQSHDWCDGDANCHFSDLPYSSVWWVSGFDGWCNFHIFGLELTFVVLNM